MSRVDLARGVPRAEAVAHVPRLRRLALAGGEERDQVEQAEGAADDAVQAGLTDAELLAHQRRLVVVELAQLRLDARGDRDRGGAGGSRVVGDGGRHGVVALVDVGDEQDGLAGQRRQVAHGVRSVLGQRHRCAQGGPPAAPRRPSAATPLRRSRPDRRSGLRGPRGRDGARPTRGRRRASSVSIVSMSAAGSTRPSGWMTFSSWWVRTTCSSASVSRMLARNLLPRPSPLLRAGDEPGDVVELDRVRDEVRGADDPRHRVEALVVHGHDGDVRLDRRERVVRRIRAGLAERVEQRGLACIGHPDDADLHHRPRLPISVPSAAPAATSEG